MREERPKLKQAVCIKGTLAPGLDILSERKKKRISTRNIPRGEEGRGGGVDEKDDDDEEDDD